MTNSDMAKRMIWAEAEVDRVRQAWAEDKDICRRRAEAAEAEVERLRAALEKIEDAILVNSIEWRALDGALKITAEALGK